MNAWTISDLNRAKAMAVDGKTAQQIGTEIGRTAHAVRFMLRANGVRLQLGRRKLDPDRDPWAHQDSVNAEIASGSRQLLEAILRAGVRP